MMDEQESHEDMLDEASEWLEQQEKILYGMPDTPSFMVDMFDRAKRNDTRKNCPRYQGLVELKINGLWVPSMVYKCVYTMGI